MKRETVSKMGETVEQLRPFADDTIEIEFHKLSYSVAGTRKKDMKSILNSVCGKFEPGKLVGILGPSGAGKTTLMNILAGFKTTNVFGRIKVNGIDRDLKHFRGKSCYIMQEESLLQFLSVKESMHIAAALKLGDQVSLKEKRVVISKTLDTMRLTAVQLTRVGKLSGGERKRLSIALELVSNPPVMFFDEPTSGLDSLNSFRCINMLKELTESRKTIICNIHQPSAKIFEIFDQIYVMAEGRCIYDGPNKAILPFLASHALDCPSFHNPADFLIEIASNQYGFYNTALENDNKKQFCISNHSNITLERERYGKKKHGTKKKGDPLLEKEHIMLNIVPQENSTSVSHVQKCATYPASFFVQFVILFIRTFKSIWRDMMLTSLRLAAHVINGLLIGTLYYKIGNDAANIYSNLGFLFFNLLFLLFTAMMPTIVTFPLEMPVMVREHYNYWYSLKSYYLSKIMADFPFQVVFPVMYMSIVYFMTGQPTEVVRFLLLLYFSVMTSLAAQSIGLLVGAAFNLQHSVFIGPVLTIPALLFSGFLVSFKAMPRFFQWLSYLSYLRYGYEGTIISIYGLNRGTMNCSESFCAFRQPEKVFELLGINENILVYDALILFVYFIVVRIMGYYALRWKLSRKE